MDKRRCGPPKFVFILFAIAAVFIFGAIVMLLWNAIITPVLSVGELSYWQAVGLLILSKILCGGFRGPGGGGGKFNGPVQRLRDKYKSMSEEEKREFKEAWQRRCRMR